MHTQIYVRSPTDDRGKEFREYIPQRLKFLRMHVFFVSEEGNKKFYWKMILEDCVL